jgi:hypothetical protein
MADQTEKCGYLRDPAPDCIVPQRTRVHKRLMFKSKLARRRDSHFWSRILRLAKLLISFHPANLEGVFPVHFIATALRVLKRRDMAVVPGNISRIPESGGAWRAALRLPARERFFTRSHQAICA